MPSPFVQKFFYATLLASAVTSLGCEPDFVPAQAPEPVDVQFRSSSTRMALFADDALIVRRHRENIIEGPPICTKSPCDALVMGGTVLRAGSAEMPSRPLQLPEKGAVRVTVDPGWGLGGMLLSGFGILGGSAGVFQGAEWLGEGKGEQGGITLGVSLAIAALSVWGFARSFPSVTVTPIAHSAPWSN
jgi:hypothetical protein